MDTTLFIKAFAALFAIMNAFVALPVFLSLTTGYTAQRQRRTAVKATLYSAILAGVILMSGTAVLGFFGISVNDFRIAGGIVLLTIGLSMLSGQGSTAHSRTPEEQAAQDAQTDVAFYPMAFPMIVGPGTITTLVLLVGDASPTTYVSVGTALAAVIGSLGLVLWFAPSIGHLLSQELRVVMTRLMGMIIAATAVQMMVAGLLAVFPGLR
ncbi:MAG: MarC family protein [Propionibacteriaceae bacterium]|jgi:multiple antibiotic resistance protein|nr:MarC family protein [Micropruina sp.]HBX82964.1 antibiotic resistance protein MarC [Propionibacteriaceae bacterium]HBY22235.1 antibiotic resistance protein MarC [Propionibacteriaceae bacterium]